MTQVRSFLDWFEGITAFMEGPPNAKQWAAIVERIGRLDGDEQVSPASPPRTPAPPVTNRKELATSDNEWKERFLDEMMEHGIDHESAIDMLTGGPDLRVMPEERARQIAKDNNMLN